MLSKIVAWLLSGVNAILLWAGYPTFPAGQKLDLDKFRLVWQDEFDGDALDRTKWGGHGFADGEVHKRRDGYWCMEMARVEDGMLHIPSIYSEEGVAGGPAGYYSLGIDTRGRFTQKYGYFEARCKLPTGQGLWSAFWMYNDVVGSADSSPQKGTEVDIYESAYWRESGCKQNAVSSNLHYYEGGYAGTLHSKNVGRFYVKKPYETFHTYGVEWNEKEYIFYIDGVESGRSSFGGVCQSELWLLLSVEHQINGWAGDISKNKPEEMTDFVIDYVRVYQYKSLL